MKPIISVGMLLISSFLTSCSSTHSAPPTQLASNFINQQKVEATTNESYAPKSPQQVAVYKHAREPRLPYKVIGVATVSKKNLLGKPRENETIHQMMKELAASIGGDGLLNIAHQEDKVVAKIIAYQKILI